MSKDEALKIALQALKTIDEAMPFPVAKLAQSAIKEALTQLEHCQCPECQVLPHASDCAVHNEPAYPKGECNCGAQQGPAIGDIRALKHRIHELEGELLGYKKIVADQEAMLEQQTARIVDLQTHIENFDGEDR